MIRPLAEIAKSFSGKIEAPGWHWPVLENLPDLYGGKAP
jgi:hypothetical protein